MRLVVVVSPSIGIVDQIAPILESVHRQSSNLECLFILPKSRIASHYSPIWYSSRLANDFASQVLVYSEVIGWIKFANFFQAKAHSRVLTLLESLQRRIQQAGITVLISPLRLSILLAYRMLRLQVFSQLSDYLGGKQFQALLDVEELRKDHLSALARILKGEEIVSIRHGVEAYPESQSHSQIEENCFFTDVSKVTWLVSSESEAKIIASRYRVKKDKIVQTGILKHHPSWKSQVRGDASFTPNDCQGKFVLLISRPSGSPYLSRDSKLQYIAEVRDFALANNLRIVIKLHPKEGDDRSFLKVLGPPGRGVQWNFSEEHIFKLSQRSVFAVTFLSSTVLDLISEGIPVIERLDLRGIPEFDNEFSTRDSDGDPAFGYRALGLCFGATTEDQFIDYGNYILENRAEAMAKLLESYHRTFPPPLEPDALTEDLFLNLRQS